MFQPKVTSLKHYPSGSYVEAWIVPLDAEMAERKIRRDWWVDDSLKEVFAVKPIDRDWDWNTMEIEWEGRLLPSEKIAIVAGDDGAVQGAMMISTQPVESVLERGRGALFVELLFTAPRNRKDLRKDEAPFLIGVGIELLTWGAWFSREQGHQGRLRLDGSPEHLGWYEKRGLQKLGLEPIVFEGVRYTPMELPSGAAQSLLSSWEE